MTKVVKINTIMFTRYLLLMILILPLIFSCNFERKSYDHLTVVRTWEYPDGSLKKTQEYTVAGLKDGIRHGNFYHYYQNGNYKETAQYVDGELHGIRVLYYENENKALKQGYANGILVWTSAYEKNGELINYMTHFNDEIRFLIRYDSLNKNIFNYRGRLVLFYYDAFDTSELIEVELNVAQPPGFDLDVKVSKFNFLDSSWVFYDKFKPDELNRVFYSQKHSAESGNRTLNIATLTHHKTDEVISDTLIINFDTNGEMTTQTKLTDWVQ